LLPKRHFVEAGVSYTYTGSFFRNSFLSTSPALGQVDRGDALPYVPVHLTSVNVGGGGRYWGLFPSLAVVGEMRDLPGRGPIPQGEEVPLHWVVDLTGQVTPTEKTTVYIQIHNLTDNAYMVSRRPYGARPGIPFQLMAGFKVQFGGRA
jgi:Fe(3+) dicitrate transport protein